MRMRLKTLYFFANRPTIGALIALGGDFGAAFSSGKPKVMSDHSLYWQMFLCCHTRPFASPNARDRITSMLTVSRRKLSI